MLRLVVALPAEARPLAERFGLARDRREGGCRLYRNAADPEDSASTMLVVTGVGRGAAAAATARLGRLSGALSCAWLNVGVAGHRARPAGDVVLAHEVVDETSGDVLHPPLVFPPPVATASVHTVDAPETAFAADAVYDMEAAAVVAAARRHATAELVHCLKVVSDGPTTDGRVTRLSAAAVSELIAAALPAVEATVARLLPLVRELRGGETTPDWIDEAVARWHFSASDRVQLARLVRRWLARAPEAEPPAAALAAADRGRDVNRILGEWIDGLPVRVETGAVVH